MLQDIDTVLYRAHRLRFALFIPFAITFTVFTAALAYDGLILGDGEVRGAWLLLPLSGVFLWFDWVILAKLIWPPELEISPGGIRWENRSMREPSTFYVWQDIDGPEQSIGGKGVTLLEMTVIATSKRLRLPPSHCGATFDEMAAVMASAKRGVILSPQAWRAENPQHPVKDWVINWGLPLAGGALIAAFVVSRR